MTTGERVKARLEELEMSQSELARRVGVSQNAIWHLIQKSKSGSRHLPQIARELGVSVEYLEGEGGNRSTHEGVERSDMVPVEIVDLAYGMGGTFLDEDADSRIEEFPLSFLRQFTKSDPGQLLIAEGMGDSMLPTIGPSDLVLIDRGQHTLNINDRIWACAVGEIGMIKRLRVRGEMVTILSDNENVSDDQAADGELHIVGRVVGKFSRL